MVSSVREISLVREQVVIRREKEPPSLITRLDLRLPCMLRRQVMPRKRHGEDKGHGSTWLTCKMHK